MKGVYNKEALNRIASQDRLDRMIVLVSPATWVSIVGAFIIIGVLLIWGFKGKLPTSVDVQGIYTNTDGSTKVYSKYEGFVMDLYAKPGDIVEEDQIIATLSTEAEYFELQQLDERIQYVENMTFDSEMDVVTSDTQEMADIKLKSKTSDQTAEQTKALLELKKEMLATAKDKVEEKEELVKKYKEEYFATLNISDEKAHLAYSEANDDYDTLYNRYEAAKNTYINSKEVYYSKRENFDAKYAEYDPDEHSDEENMVYDAALADVESARTETADREYFMKEQEKLVIEANDKLASARKEYLEYINKTSGDQANNTIASTEYSEVLQDYYTAKNSYKALSDEIDQLELQAVLDEGSAEVQAENYVTEFDNKKSAVLTSLNAQRDAKLNEMERHEVRASASGEVYSVNIEKGKLVPKGSEALTLLSGDLALDTVICYVKLSDAKKLKEGMLSYICPSTVRKQEYGHIEGKVSYVDEYVATRQEIEYQLGSDSLMETFAKDGPVVMVKCEMTEDDSFASGYHWSSDRGRNIQLTSGTLVSATIITEEKRPIDLLIPYIKEKLDFDGDEEVSGK